MVARTIGQAAVHVAFLRNGGCDVTLQRHPARRPSRVGSSHLPARLRSGDPNARSTLRHSVKSHSSVRS